MKNRDVDSLDPGQKYAEIGELLGRFGRPLAPKRSHVFIAIRTV